MPKPLIEVLADFLDEDEDARLREFLDTKMPSSGKAVNHRLQVPLTASISRIPSTIAH